MHEEFIKKINKISTISGVVSGYEAFVLDTIYKQTQNDIIYIASDGVSLEQTAEVLLAINPKIELLKFPAWDTVPYDRVSPNPTIIAKRVDTLAKLSFVPKGKRVIVTSVGAIMQKLPPQKNLLLAKNLVLIVFCTMFL